MAQFEQHFVQDLTQQIKVRHCGSIVFNADNESNVVSVRLFNGSEPVAISGSVVGAVVCSDGSTVPLTGSYSGNTASITLTGDCFAVLGQIGVGIQIVNGTQKTTVLKVIYNVETLTTENVVDPGSRITLEVGDLVDDIEAAVASIPADYSDLLAAIAPNYSELTFPVKAGAFCWYNGALYQAQQGIATSEAWTAAHWASAVLTTSLDEKLADVDDEIGDLKSNVDDNIFNYHSTEDAAFVIGGLTSTGAVNDENTQRVRCNYMYAKKGSKISIANGFLFNIALYTAPQTSAFISDSYRGFENTPYTIGRDCYFIVSGRDENSTAWTEQTMSTVVNAFDFAIIQDDYLKVATKEELYDAVPTANNIADVVGNVTISYSDVGTANGWDNKTTGLVIDSPITNAVALSNVKINVRTAPAKLWFGLLTKDGSTGTVTHIIELSSNSEQIDAQVNFYLDKTKDYYPFIRMNDGAISFSSDSSVSQYSTFSESGDIDAGDEFTLTAVSGNGIKLVGCTLIEPIASAPQNTIVVAKSGGNYTTISEAVTYAKTIASATTPVTILIYPGTYDEVVNLGANPRISLVGVNRDTCIIRDTSGKYANSPVKASGNFTISNLTIIANHDNAGLWYPTWTVGDNTTFASYCVHCDGTGGSSSNPAVGRFENCRLYSECSNAAGLGLNPYQTLEFDNCVIERNVSDSHYLDANYYGALACHSSLYPLADESAEHLVLKNCMIMSSDDYAVQLSHYHSGSPMDVTAIGNTLKNENGINNVVYVHNDTIADYIGIMSHGNSTAELDYVSN